MLFNSCDASHLYNDHETCKLHSFNTNSYSTQLRPMGSVPSVQHSAFQVRGSHMGVHPAESYGQLQSEDGGRYFQNMLHDACNRDDYWRAHDHQQKVEPTYSARPNYHHYHHRRHHPSIAMSHLQWNRNLIGYENFTGEMVDHRQYSANAYQAVQHSQSHDSSEDMTLFSNRSIDGQTGIVEKNRHAPLHLPFFDQRHHHTLSDRDIDDLKCSEANPPSVLKCNSSSSRLMQRHSVSDNSVPTTSGSNHSPQTQIKVECASVSSQLWKTEESKLDAKNLGSSSEDVQKNSLPSLSVDTRQRKSAKSTGKTRTKEKYRTVYSESQRQELERLYTSAAYIATSDHKNAIARCVGLTDRQVKIWFQNRRAKERKDRRKTTEESRQCNQHQQ